MKNSMLSMIFILIVSVPSTGYGANFQYIGKTPSSFFGRPFEVLEVQPTGKDFQDKLNKKFITLTELCSKGLAEITDGVLPESVASE